MTGKKQENILKYVKQVIQKILQVRPTNLTKIGITDEKRMQVKRAGGQTPKKVPLKKKVKQQAIQCNFPPLLTVFSEL